MRQTLARRAATLGLAFSALAAHAATTYTIIDLGRLPQADAGTYAYAVNGKGQVAGASGNPFLWDAGTMVNLNATLPPSVFAPARAEDANDAGTVVGFFTANATIHPFRWVAGAFTDLAPTAATPQRAISVNTNGDVLIEAPASYLLRADGSRVTLSGPVAGTTIDPAGLNDAGQVAGHTQTAGKTDVAVLWQDGKATPLGTLPGDVNSAATALDNDGTVVGISYGPTVTTTNIRPWIWRAGSMLALPARATFESCVPVAVNGRGQVVGYVGTDVRGGEKAALLWENGQVTDLQAKVPAGSGWSLRAARDINDTGQITGYGVLGGVYRAFLMTPVPPPLVPGDANSDGDVTPLDAGLVLDMAAGLRPAGDMALLDLAPAPSADPRGYGDGKIDADDAIRILRIANGLG